MVYAIKGVDRINKAAVETVLEARDEDSARRFADEKSLDIEKITLLHPLNGATALQAARADGDDRFNQPVPMVVGSIKSHHTTTAATAAETAADPPQDLKPTQAFQPPAPTPTPPPPTTSPGITQPLTAPLAFNTPALPRPSALPKNSNTFAATVAIGLMLAAMGGLLYFIVFRGHSIDDLIALVSRRPTPITTVETTETTTPSIDQLIADSQTPNVSIPMLPRSMRGPSHAASQTKTVSAPEKIRRPIRRPSADTPAFTLTQINTQGPEAGSTYATINGQDLRLGQQINGYQLLQINHDSVILQRNGRIIGLALPTPDTDSD